MTLSEDTSKLQDYIKNNSNIGNKSEKEISETYQQLIDCITDHNHLYYIENTSIISDLEYDELFDYLKRIEEYFPHLISGNSPTQTLVNQFFVPLDRGGKGGFGIAKHTTNLLSLENTYNAQDLTDRDERVRKNLEKNENNIVGEHLVKSSETCPGQCGVISTNHPTLAPNNAGSSDNIIGHLQNSFSDIIYSIEPKFDGISVELIYKNGKLHQAITRGDGLVGEDITTNVKTIKNIPSKLSDKLDISVRGEIMMPKSVWKRLNIERESNGEQPFANTRNAAAGSIKLLDSGEVSKRGLVCFVYDILETVILSKAKYPGIIDLKQLGLPIFDWKKTSDNISDVINICLDEETKSYLENQDCDFDGLVIKVQDNKQREIIGTTQHHPKRAVAYKFPAQQISTQILSIDFQIGRTGIITPVANLSPVQLSGATISRTTLHNFDFINTKDIKIGDYVRLQRSGEVIPYIVGVIKDKRNGSETTVNPPTKCPVCNSKIINQDIHYYCSSDNCPAQIKAKLEHFVSKNCMDIMGIGDSIIDILVDQKVVLNIADLFKLSDSSYQILLQKFPGFANKKVSEIANQLIQAKEKPLRRLLNGLGVGHVGKKTAIMIVDNLINYYSLKNEELSPLENLIKHITDQDFLNSIFGIGEKTLQEIIDFFDNKNNLDILKKLEESGLNFDPIKYYKDKENLGIFEGLNNGSFSITGSFPVSRESMVQEMQKHGRTFHENPKKDTEIILIGEKPGSKKAKAQELEIRIIEDRNNIIQEFEFLANIPNLDKTINKSSDKPASQHSLF